MMKRKCSLGFLVLTLVLFAGSFNKSAAQIQNSIAIVLNEYCVGNIVPGISDNYGQTSDWVEIRNNHTASVSLSGYYLSNDRNNLTKWKFPSSFTLGVGQMAAVFLSGRNESKQVGGIWYHHANFNIDQCKNQWLILSSPQVAIRDSVAIQRTKAGHTRGRIDANIMGVQGWRVYINHSFLLANPPSGYYKGYLPTPTFTPEAGWGHNGKTVDMFLNNSIIPYDGYDSLNCYEIHYTINSCEPTINDPVYTFTSPACNGGGPIIIIDNMVVRAVTYPKQSVGTCSAYSFCYPELDEWLPSFVQTNSYLSNGATLDNLDPNFGLVSINHNCADSSWLNTNGSTEPTVHIEYFDCAKKTSTQLLEGYGSLYRPPHESWLTQQKGFYMTMDDRRGWGCNFEYPFFDNAVLGTSSRSVFPTLHVYGGDHESLSNKSGNALPKAMGTGLRDVFLQSLAIKYNIEVNPLHMKPLIVFINGTYRGAYTLKEVYDRFYEAYYKKQNKDSCFMQSYYYNDGFEYHPVDNYVANPQKIGVPDNIFRTEVYNYAISNAMNAFPFYNTLMSRLDKKSFIDYMITQSYVMNSDMYNVNVAFAKGYDKTKPGDKWHYFLWNTPAIFQYTSTNTNTLVLNSGFTSPCLTHSVFPQPSLFGGNAHGGILKRLMDPFTGNPSFQLDYKTRYQDLLNTAFRCDNILAHYDQVVALYKKEFHFMEDPGSVPASYFVTEMGSYDTNTAQLRRNILRRCEYMSGAFTATSNCYGMFGPYDLKVDVYPENAGQVRVNSILVNNFTWTGKFMKPAQISFKAIPTSTNHVFHHWEFKSHLPMHGAPLSYDSLAIDFNNHEEVLAVFTDVTTDIDLPTGFSPNGDGNNDFFKPQGSALHVKEYEMRVWNRWGQEVFRSTDPTYGWDGYFESRQSQTGVYAYVVTYKNIYNEAKIKKGNVTLIR